VPLKGPQGGVRARSLARSRRGNLRPPHCRGIGAEPDLTFRCEVVHVPNDPGARGDRRHRQDFVGRCIDPDQLVRIRAGIDDPEDARRIERGPVRLTVGPRRQHQLGESVRKRVEAAREAAMVVCIPNLAGLRDLEAPRFLSGVVRQDARHSGGKDVATSNKICGSRQILLLRSGLPGARTPLQGGASFYGGREHRPHLARFRL
jgi:hypothetical protein